jgi:hypothetical protein
MANTSRYKREILNMYIYEGKEKVLGLAYNRRETRDKWPLDRDLDRSWCHLHTSVKLFWLQPMVP